VAKVVLVGALLVVAAALGRWWQARNGRFRATSAATAPDSTSPPGSDEVAPTTEPREVLTSDVLGVPLGDRATFVQLSAEVCSACASTRRVLAAVSAEHPGVLHVELDAAEHLDLVRRFSVMRTPTTLVLAHDGTVVGRMSGGTDRRQALTALESCPDVAPAR